MSSMYLSNLKISIFGQSHSAAVGAVIDGLPAGEKIDMDALNAFLRRRAPGRNEWSSARKEADVPEILSGLVDDTTCGAPLCVVIRNADARSEDYAGLRDVPRPGHADYPAQIKYSGFQDAAGGGHFSGRLTAPLCAAGGVCMQILARRGVKIGAHLLSVADVKDRAYDPALLTEEALLSAAEKDFPTLDAAAGEAMRARILAAQAAGDSVGGVIECAAAGVPAGLGDPMFDGMENRISRIVFAIPAVRGIEFGSGFEAAAMYGSRHNDPYEMRGGKVCMKTNHSGGILGGVTTGMPVIFRAAVKPTPSIALEQDSVSLSRGENVKLRVKGRHDPCIAPRAVPCMEAAMAIALLDAMPEGK